MLFVIPMIPSWFTFSGMILKPYWKGGRWFGNPRTHGVCCWNCRTVLSLGSFNFKMQPSYFVLNLFGGSTHVETKEPAFTFWFRPVGDFNFPNYLFLFLAAIGCAEVPLINLSRDCLVSCARGWPLFQVSTCVGSGFIPRNDVQPDIETLTHFDFDSLVKFKLKC